MNHYEVLRGNYKLVFAHSVPMPTIGTDFNAIGLKLWYVDNGFIAIAPKRLVSFEECMFVFPYQVHGNTAYLCTFDEIQPSNYRIPRNSGTVQIAGNKNAVSFHKGIATIYKELNKAIYYHSRITFRTKPYAGYITNSVLKSAGGLFPSHVYNNTVYALYVDFRCRRAEYKPLISQTDIMKLYNFVESQKSSVWEKSFGFTQKTFLELIEKADK